MRNDVHPIRCINPMNLSICTKKSTKDKQHKKLVSNNLQTSDLIFEKCTIISKKAKLTFFGFTTCKLHLMQNFSALFVLSS